MLCGIEYYYLAYYYLYTMLCTVQFQNESVTRMHLNDQQ